MENGDFMSDSATGFFIRGELVRFKDKLREAMNGESNRAFGAKCQLSEAVIRNYLSGKTYPTLDRLAVIASVTGRPIEWFLSDNPDTAHLKTQEIDMAVLHDQLMSVLKLMNPEELQLAINIFKTKGLTGLMPDVIGQAPETSARKEILQQRVQPGRAQAAGSEIGPQGGKKKTG